MHHDFCIDAHSSTEALKGGKDGLGRPAKLLADPISIGANFCSGVLLVDAVCLFNKVSQKFGDIHKCR